MKGLCVPQNIDDGFVYNTVGGAIALRRGKREDGRAGGSQQEQLVFFPTWWQNDLPLTAKGSLISTR